MAHPAAGKRAVCAKREVTNLGGSSKDDFDGGAADDVFKLKGAADRIAGAGGDDAACGGGGRDPLIGGSGRDTCEEAKIRERCGWAPEVGLADGLAPAIEWYRAHPEARPN